MCVRRYEGFESFIFKYFLFVRQSQKERTYRRLNKAKNFLFYKRRQCKKEEDEKKVIIKSFTSTGRLRAVSLRTDHGRMR